MDSCWETIQRQGLSFLVSCNRALNSPEDLWAHTDNGTAVRQYTAHDVPPHGVAALLLTDAGDEPEGTLPPCAQPEWCMSQNGTRIDQ